MAYRDMLDENGLRRYEAYWRWYTSRKQRGDLVAGAPCFAGGAEHEARVLAEHENERIRELKRENRDMLVLATECAGVLQRQLGAPELDILEKLRVKIDEWVARNGG